MSLYPMHHQVEEVYMIQEAEENREMKGAPYGTWKSPITAEEAAEGAVKILNVIVDGDDVYWNEVRPKNEGRYTIVKNGEDVTPPDFSARSAVHEYGGGAFTVKEDTVVTSNFRDKKLYIKEPGKDLRPLTTGKDTRFGDLHITQHGIVAVGETHKPDQEPENFLALIDIQTGTFKKIASGYDFYTSPAISPDGKKIAYICWKHPNMPWTDTELWIANIDEMGNLINSVQVAGQDPETIFQPGWDKDGTLYFVTDRDEWWNLHRYVDGKIENMCKMEAEMGWPLWQLQRSKWTFLGEKLLFACVEKGFMHLGILDPATGKCEKIESPGVTYLQLRSGNGFVVFIEGFDNQSSRIVKMDNKTLARTVIKEPEGKTFNEGYISTPQHITYKSAGGREAYGYFYPPKNKDYKGKEGELPPLIVMIHGGPTSKTLPTFALQKQFWTSQGFAILDVDYGGSTGYGRTYRMALNGNWGIVDVEDCIFGAKHLAEQGLVDKDKLLIRGGSAGGYTTLAALTYEDTFKGGADYYGIADLEALAHDTHKFESHYNDTLLGPFNEKAHIWKERSPINHMDKFNSPLIIFQGTEDKIVPPNQSKMIYEALKKKGIKTELYLYEKEQHGFRKKKNIINSLNKEADFYREIMGV